MVTKLVSTGIQFYSPAERDRGAVDFIAGLGTGEAVVFTEGAIPPFKTLTPMAADAFDHARRFGDKKMKQFLVQQAELLLFAKPEEVISLHHEFVQKLLEELYLLPAIDVPGKRRNQPLTGNLLLPKISQPEDLGL